MMRLFPGSLFGRMVLILLVGLLLVQLLSVFLLLRDRTELTYRTSGLYLAQRIVGMVQVLDALSPPERGRILPALNLPPIQLSLSAQPKVLADGALADRRPAVLLRLLLQRHLGSRAFHVAVHERVFTAPAQPGPVDIQPLHDLALTVQVQLSDGVWAVFERRLDTELLDSPRRLLLTLAFLVVSVVVLALVAVRFITRPLSALARAAEQLGRDLRHAPLAEAGPVEVRQAAHAFNRMQRRLLRYLEDRTRILSAVSHDLKTPITRLRLRSELLEEESLREKFLQDLNDMENMVSETLDFMRSADDGEPLHPVDINALLASLQSDAQETGQAVTVSGEAAAPYPAHPLALKRCVSNILDNALHYGGGAAAITIDDTQGRLCIAIEDEGPGLPEADIERVFEPFYRHEASRSRHTGGTGLGLGIARNIARAHGGDVVLSNRPGKGITAILTLPR